MKLAGIKLAGSWSLKGSKLIKVPHYRDASHAIRARKSTKQKVVRPAP